MGTYRCSACGVMAFEGQPCHGCSAKDWENQKAQQREAKHQAAMLAEAKKQTKAAQAARNKSTASPSVGNAAAGSTSALADHFGKSIEKSNDRAATFWARVFLWLFDIPENERVETIRPMLGRLTTSERRISVAVVIGIIVAYKVVSGISSCVAGA